MKYTEELKEFIQRDAENMRSLTFSENYIKEVIANTEKWGKIGLLQGIPDPYMTRQVARLLENQLLQNEQRENFHLPDGAFSTWNEPQWKRVSIPAIRRTFGSSFLPSHLVSVQAMSKLQDNFYYTGLDERQNSVLLSAKTRWIGAEWWKPVDTHYNLDQEANELAIFCQRYVNEVNVEVIKDLTNNSGSYAKAEYVDPDHLLSLVNGMSSYIAAKLKGREASWIVANPNVTAILKPYVKEWKEDEKVADSNEDMQNYVALSVKYRGLVNDKWKLYEHVHQPLEKILMGHKDSRNHYFSGYFYCPYLPFEASPGYVKGQEKQPNIIWARYGKKLVEANFYGVIDVSGIEPKKKEEA
jgi:hypothetical protein